jgi:hypothetical protein
MNLGSCLTRNELAHFVQHGHSFTAPQTALLTKQVLPSSLHQHLQDALRPPASLQSLWQGTDSLHGPVARHLLCMTSSEGSLIELRAVLSIASVP